MSKPRLLEKYNSEIKKHLQESLKIKNTHQVPSLEKIVIAYGVGDAARDSKIIKTVETELAKITGQKPKLDKSKVAIANFKLREGIYIGAHSTVRGDRAWELLDRIISLALPRIRDFRGLSKKQFDGNGNYTFGFTEQSVFHELDPNSIDTPRGMNVTIVTTTSDDKSAKAFLDAYGFPFKKKKSKG